MKCLRVVEDRGKRNCVLRRKGFGEVNSSNGGVAVIIKGNFTMINETAVVGVNGEEESVFFLFCSDGKVWREFGRVLRDGDLKEGAGVILRE